MAEIRTVRLVDDLDGSDAVETVAFALDGRSYEIDLSEAHAAELRAALARFIAAARRTGGPGARPKLVSVGGSSARPGTDRELNQKIREWARGEGFRISERGRIPTEVIEAYENRDARRPAQAAAVTPPAEDTTPDEIGPETGDQGEDEGDVPELVERDWEANPPTDEEIVAWYQVKGLSIPKNHRPGTVNGLMKARFLKDKLPKVEQSA